MLGTELLFQLAERGDHLVSTYRTDHKLNFARKQFQLIGDEGLKACSSVDWQNCDLLDLPRLREVLTGVDLIYHCAALVSFDTADDQALIDNNVQATANLMNLAREAGVKKVIHVSSVAALGRNVTGGMIDENSQWTGRKENSAYARSKYQAELEAWRASEEGLPLVIVNPSIIIGPGDWQTGSSALFGKIAGGFKFYSEGINAYVDVRDVAAAMIQLMDSDILGERFVLMAENRSYREVFEMIADALRVQRPSIAAKPWMGAAVWRLEKLRALITGKPPMVTPDTVQTSFQANYYSNEKLRKTLGVEFRRVENTIAHVADLYHKDNPLS